MTPDRRATPGGEPPRPASRRSVASDELFQGHRELVIVHGDEEYRLRITRAGKLILTK
jgi:hemin uptake protein HemP